MAGGHAIYGIKHIGVVASSLSMIVRDCVEAEDIFPKFCFVIMHELVSVYVPTQVFVARLVLAIGSLATIRARGCSSLVFAVSFCTLRFAHNTVFWQSLRVAIAMHCEAFVCVCVSSEVRFIVGQYGCT